LPSMASRSALEKRCFSSAAPTGNPHSFRLRVPSLARPLWLRLAPVLPSMASRSVLEKRCFSSAAPTGPHPTEPQTRSWLLQAIPGGRRGIICEWRGLASSWLTECDSHLWIRSLSQVSRQRIPRQRGFESSPSGGLLAADAVNTSLWAPGSASCLARPPQAARQTATHAVQTPETDLCCD